MGTTYVRASLTLVLGLALLAPLGAQTPDVVVDPERATQLEAEAARLQVLANRWADAASLYVAAAELRQEEDPQARQNLFLAANLRYQVGDHAGAVAALESAGSRSLSAGDSVFATEMFANAASIAEEAGLVEQERTLRSRVAGLAGASRARRGRS
jgi:hypothetical protein